MILDELGIDFGFFIGSCLWHNCLWYKNSSNCDRSTSSFNLSFEHSNYRSTTLVRGTIGTNNHTRKICCDLCLEKYEANK